MDENQLRKSLADLPLGGIRFLQKTASTNDDALAWATEDANDLSLVVADEQTAGRGRLGRRWITPPGTALALSLILHPTPIEGEHFALLSGLGALALTRLLKGHGLAASVKWPNDVLIAGQKVAGILVEAVWLGDKVESVVVGMGVNVLPESIPPEREVQFPATSVHSEGVLIDRIDLLHDLLMSIASLRPLIGSEAFINEWENALAFKNEPVKVWTESANESLLADASLTGILRGLDSDGSLILDTPMGVQKINYGEIRLRPVK